MDAFREVALGRLEFGVASEARAVQPDLAPAGAGDIEPSARSRGLHLEGEEAVDGVSAPACGEANPIGVPVLPVEQSGLEPGGRAPGGFRLAVVADARLPVDPVPALGFGAAVTVSDGRGGFDPIGIPEPRPRLQGLRGGRRPDLPMRLPGVCPTAFIAPRQFRRAFAQTQRILQIVGFEAQGNQCGWTWGWHFEVCSCEWERQGQSSFASLL